MLLHGLQQRTLHLGGRAVDLVGEYEVGKDGTLLDEEALLLLRVDHRAHHVGGEQVGGKLDAVEVGIDQFRKGADGQRLGQSGHALQQHVAVGEETDEQRFYEVLLAHDHVAHAGGDVGHKRTLLLDAGVELANINGF